MSGDAGENRHLPRNLEGLFRFCAENTATEDAPDASRFEPMTDERGSHFGQQHEDAASDCSSTLTTLPDLEIARRNQNKALSTLGLYRYKIPGDGNCMFRAVASQLRLDQERYHPILRKAAVAWMWQHVDELLAGGLLDETSEIEETCTLGAWPSQAALVSLANVLEINIALIQGGDQGNLDIQHVTPFETPVNQDCGGIILAYLYNGHYDAVVHEPNLPNPEYRIWVGKVKERYAVEDDLAQELAMHDPYSPYLSCVSDDNSFDEAQAQDPIPAESPPIRDKKRALFCSGNSWNAFSTQVEDTPSSSSKSTTSEKSHCFSPEPSQDGYESSGKDSLRLSHPDLSEVALGPIDGKHLEEELECLQKAAEELQSKGFACGMPMLASQDDANSDHSSTPSSTHSFIIHDDIDQAPVTEHMQEVMELPEKETKQISKQTLRAQASGEYISPCSILEEEEQDVKQRDQIQLVDVDLDSERESSHSSLPPSSSDSIKTDHDSPYVHESVASTLSDTVSPLNRLGQHLHGGDSYWSGPFPLRRNRPDGGKTRPHSVHDPGFAQSAFAKISQSSVPLLRESLRKSHTVLPSKDENTESTSAFRPIEADKPRAQNFSPLAQPQALTKTRIDPQPMSGSSSFPAVSRAGMPTFHLVGATSPENSNTGRQVNPSSGVRQRSSLHNKSAITPKERFANQEQLASDTDTNQYVERSESTTIRVEPKRSSSSSSRTVHIPINIVGPTYTKTPIQIHGRGVPGPQPAPVTAIRVEKSISVGNPRLSHNVPIQPTQKLVLDSSNRPTSVVRLETWDRPQQPTYPSYQDDIQISQLRSPSYASDAASVPITLTQSQPHITQIGHHVPNESYDTQASRRPTPYVRLTTQGNSIVIPTNRQVQLTQDISSPQSPNAIRINITSETQRAPTVHRISAKPGSVIQIPIKISSSDSSSINPRPTITSTHPAQVRSAPWRHFQEQDSGPQVQYALNEVLRPLKSQYDVDRIESLLKKELFK